MCYIILFPSYLPFPIYLLATTFIPMYRFVLKLGLFSYLKAQFIVKQGKVENYTIK